MVMDIKEIMETIPHRQPFLLIDRIEELKPGNARWGKNAFLITNRFSTAIFRRNP